LQPRHILLTGGLSPVFLTEKLVLFALFMVLTPLLSAFLAWRTYTFAIQQEKKESPSPVERSNRILRR
jgi:hypothetical protein